MRVNKEGKKKKKKRNPEIRVSIVRTTTLVQFVSFARRS